MDMDRIRSVLGNFVKSRKDLCTNPSDQSLQSLLLSEKMISEEWNINNKRPLLDINISCKHESPFSLVLNCKVSAKQKAGEMLSLRPKTPWSVGSETLVWFIILIENKTKPQPLKDYTQPSSTWSTELNVSELDPDSKYVAHILALTNLTLERYPAAQNNSESILRANLLAFGSHPFLTILSKTQLQLLRKKAVDCLKISNSRKVQTIRYLYRNKSPEYFCHIMQGSGIMEPYMKDFNGDPRNPINGCLRGLFFSGLLDKKSAQLNPVSPFGTQRLTIPLHRLFNVHSNLYFDDFYCYHLHKPVHYVTLVITNPPSTADDFCKEKLLELDKYNNPFLSLVCCESDAEEVCLGLSQKETEPSGIISKNIPHCDICGSETCEEAIFETKRPHIGEHMVARLCIGIHVELFYTESLNVRKELQSYGAQFSTTPTIGRGFSLPEGVPKNSLCSVCNIWDSNNN